jgi:hypothetical protein
MSYWYLGMVKYPMQKLPEPLPQYSHHSHCLVVLNGPSGDLVPDLDCETFVCNGNFQRRRADHVVSIDRHRVQFAREHGRTVWTRPRFCRTGDYPVPDNHNIFNDSGNAAIWAAHNLYQTIIIAGADSWLGGDTRTVCDELYTVADKKLKLPPIWFRKFQEWTGPTSNTYIFVWPTLKLGVRTLTWQRVRDKYSGPAPE